MSALPGNVISASVVMSPLQRIFTADINLNIITPAILADGPDSISWSIKGPIL